MTLFGREAEWNELTAAFAAGRMHHAWLLQGRQGVGKATTAFAFARTVLGGPGVVAASEDDALVFDPANRVVRQIALANHPNLLHLTRPPAERSAGFKTQITIDEIRRLNHFFHSTAGGGWRVAIIDPADDMNRNAANALLKILEEPPERSIFLIANHSAGQILPTIRSRCRVLRFPELLRGAVVASLRQTLPEAPDADILAFAAASQGSLRTALLMAKNGGLEIEKEVDRIYAAMGPDWPAIHALADALSQRGRDVVWQLVLDRVLTRTADETRQLAMKGEGAAADAFARFCTNEAVRWREAAAYNLDRKQMLVTFFSRLSLLRAGITSETETASFH